MNSKYYDIDAIKLKMMYETKKRCPIKNSEDVAIFVNCSVSERTDEIAEMLGVKSIVSISDGVDKSSRVEYVGGVCDKEKCAWWDARKERCAVLSIARNK